MKLSITPELFEKTVSAVLVLEAVPPISLDELETAARGLERLVLEHCGGDARVELLDRQRPDVVLEPR
jgi:DNA/RNA-binding domain of Phe-tRNA-synthetase-like protein